MDGATLFIPESKDDHDAAVALMNSRMSTQFHEPNDVGWAWVGMHDHAVDSEFAVLPGLSMDQTYHRWSIKKPSNEIDEDCIALSSHGEISDNLCTLTHPFICKKSRWNVKWDTPCNMADQGYTYEPAFGKCYRVHEKPLSWYEAYKVCAAEQSYLAIPNSKKELEFINTVIAEAPKKKVKYDYMHDFMHLGYYRPNFTNAMFVTLQEQLLDDAGFAEWEKNEPNNLGGIESYGSAYKYKLLNDIWVGLVSEFVCEHDP